MLADDERWSKEDISRLSLLNTTNSSNKKIEQKFKFICFFCSRKMQTNFLLSVASLLLSLGFLFGSANANYDLLYAITNAASWSAIFFSYGVIKLASCFDDINRWIREANGMLGVWAWTCIFLSFTVFDTSPVAPTEFLLAVPVIAELWVMLSIFDFHAKDSKDCYGL